MEKIIECVPNFSEGRDLQKIEQIANIIEKVNSIKLLNVESDSDYNRTVITFAGRPEAVKDAAFCAIETAAKIIDMSHHKGAHPRIGATDVCPFVPVRNVSQEECIRIAKTLGQEVGERLGIPVYLYGEAALMPDRALLSDIRKGEYEGLSKKLRDMQGRPDYGPLEFNEKVKRTGATVIGVREFLIAYNVNVDSQDVAIANKIAGIVRTSGVVKINDKGEKIRVPGSLKCVQAMGVLLKEHTITQVSMNLQNYKVTPIHIAFEEVRKTAHMLGQNVMGSEIIGLVPMDAIVDAGRYYSQKMSEEELIKSAIENLGLNQLKNFLPHEKIIEYMLGFDARR